MSIRLIPVFFTLSKSPANDLTRFKKKFKLVGSEHYGLSFVAKVPEGFNKGDLEIPTTNSQLNLFLAIKKKSLAYWEQLEEKWLLSSKRKGGEATIKIQQTAQTFDKTWLVTVYQNNKPVLNFYIEER